MPSEKMFQTAFVCDAHDDVLFSQNQSRLRLPCCQQPAALHTTPKKQPKTLSALQTDFWGWLSFFRRPAASRPSEKRAQRQSGEIMLCLPLYFYPV